MTAPIHRWVGAPLDLAVERALTRLAASDDVVHVAAMPDVHLADDVCVGCVTATRTSLYPEAVGGDIGCGMAAVRFSVAADRLDRDRAARLLWHLGRFIPVIQHPTAAAALPSGLADRPLSTPALNKLAATIGRVQHATLGRGNHFVELQRADDDGALWLMLHSGSRGIGQAIRDHHRGCARPGSTGLARLDAEDDRGRAYLDDLAWALEYALASRRAMAERVAEGVATVLGAEPAWDTYRDCHHNAVRREVHGGEALWIHRKGAIHAGGDVSGVIPGSMGTPSYHVRGRGEATSLCSSSHGAGRAMSRGEARRRISAQAFARQVDGVWYDHRLSERLRDEAPGAYKDIGRVMRAQRELVRVERALTPILCYKGG